MSVFAGAMLMSCGESEEKDAPEDVSAPMQNEMHQMEEEEIDQDVTEEVVFEDEQIGAAYESYHNLKQALVDSNAEVAGAAAEELAQDLADAEVREVVFEAVRKIASADDINVQRTAFAELTEPIQGLVAGAIVSGKIFKQYCPMAFEGAGAYWLSSTEVVANPYFGEKMLRCGSTKEVLQ